MFKNKIIALPIAASGLAFGLAGLGFNWEKFYPMAGYVQIPSAIIAFTLACLVMLKLWLSPFNFLAAMQDINIGPASPTLPLVLMIASVNLSGYPALFLWLFAVIMHIIILIYFIVTRYLNFNFQEVSTTWFIPFVAFSIAAFTNPGLEVALPFFDHLGSHLPSKKTINQIILIFSISSYLLLLPVILYRLMGQNYAIIKQQPSLVLVAAPANLSLLGYLSAFDSHAILFLGLLIFLAISMTLFSYFCIWQQRANGFNPALSGYTFPLVIGAPAMQATSDFFTKFETSNTLVYFFSYLANLQLYIAAAVTLTVFYLYLKFIMRPNNKSSESHKLS